ncbi:unnamed protein product [Ambrosiozyma monospora]|uniref:Unnamed protein product n=1 Tax=Ambrosiozyma monospora TaxID=43982 RepID=A0ACB5U9M7_AMBMO|nr:unnamed protein product [Ambrosiozyma monospora]
MNVIVDARPVKNAIAQHAIGGGTENGDNYKNVKRIFLNIENIHTMRESLGKVKEALKDSDISSELINKELLEKSNWLYHVRNILKQVDLLTKTIELNSMHLVVHCSDGWDRTAQIVSLIQICLDPYYRTLEGFIVLIEKEWCSFGHKFNERLGHLINESNFTNNTNGNGKMGGAGSMLNAIKDNILNDDLESPLSIWNFFV